MTRWPLTPLPVEPEEPSKMHLAINLNFEQGHEVVHGRQIHTIGSFSTIQCSCKSKSHIVTNFPMRPRAISSVELAGYGVHAVAASAPALGLTLFGRTAFDDQGTWTACSPPTSLRESKPAPFQKFQQRLRSFSAPTLSIIAKSTCFNTYILSVMPYTASYFGLSTADLNYLRQQAVKFILGRHWIEAGIFPYILRYIGVSVLLDPALSATVAATGLYFREGNRYEDLWIEHSDSSGCNLRQKAIVRDLLQLWVPYIQLSDMAAALTDHKNGVTGRLDRLKKVIIAGMVLAARTQLRKKITREGWSQGISVEWVDLVLELPGSHCSVGRSIRMMTFGLLCKVHVITAYVVSVCNLVTPFLAGFTILPFVNIAWPPKELHQCNTARLVLSCKMRSTVLPPPFQGVQLKLLSL